MKRRTAFLWVRIIVLASIAFSITHLPAQQVGHYLQGFTGLENGTMPPPGFYAAYAPALNLINSFKGPNGNSIVDNLDLNVVAHAAIFQMTMPKKVLGGTYGWVFMVPVVNTRVVADVFNTSVQSAGLSDLFFSPIVLGWEKGKLNYTVNYGFYAPTGDFDPNSAFNPGLGFWEHQIQAGTTYNIDKKKLWNASLLSTWEINQSKLGEDLKAGPMVTFEYSFGRRLFKYAANVGVAGYAYQKLSADSGSQVNPLFSGALDRSFGAGPEFKYTSVKHHVAFDVRYEPQFGVQARTSGNMVFISLTYLDFFAPK